MNSKLLISGRSFEGEIMDLNLENDEFFTFGRSAECDLRLEDSSVSRKHCHIRYKEGFWIEDLGSHNGTFVNDLRVTAQLLQHNDQITIGKFSIVFSDQETVKLSRIKAELDAGTLITNSDVRISPLEDTAEFSSDLTTLIKLGKAVSEHKNAEILQKRILEIILELVPAKRGAILIIDEEFNDLQLICHSVADNLNAEPMKISRTVCQQVINEQTALLSNDLKDSNLSGAESLTSSHVSSLLCVPLRIGERTGVLYLDSYDANFRFTKSHLEQLTAISYIISAVIFGSESIEILERENEFLRSSVKVETDLVGHSEAMQKVLYLISKVASAEATVLIDGESGTGKELVAKTIHQNSQRKGRLFVAINCAVLNENLLESELFGHEKGAFTGASIQKKGKFELAEGGTIFLDEIGELAPQLQAKLLRVLQEREFERVGGDRPIKTNVRVLAATNRNLADEVKNGNFRQDLYFRLNVINLKIPPLRARETDIPLLAQYFIEKHSEKCNRTVIGLSAEARKILLNYEWQGNVRELENSIERAIVLGSTETIQPDDLPGNILSSVNTKKVIEGNFHEQVKIAKQRIVTNSINEAKGNYTEAARILGLHPNNLHRLIRSLGMKVGEKN